MLQIELTIMIKMVIKVGLSWVNCIHFRAVLTFVVVGLWPWLSLGFRPHGSHTETNDQA